MLLLLTLTAVISIGLSFRQNEYKYQRSSKPWTLAAIIPDLISMTHYDRYINGETEIVYEDIYKLGEDAFIEDNFADIEKVLTETFERVAYNLDIICKELTNINYLFKTDFEFNFERPLSKPLADADKLLTRLDKSVRLFGFVPLSLKMFYKIVGACNFGWDNVQTHCIGSV